jgi:SSS family solute:Na+ symporter
MIAYPLVIALLFFPAVLIGVWGRGVVSDFSPADQILPYMVKAYAPEWVFSFVIVGALSALMSTADSQILVLSTMLTHDLRLRGGVVKSKLTTVLLAAATIAFICFGFDYKTGIFGTLVSTTFAGLVVLFPTTVAALYFPNTRASSALASIIVGEASIALFYAGILPTFGFLDGILALAISAVVLFVSEVFLAKTMK